MFWSTLFEVICIFLEIWTDFLEEGFVTSFRFCDAHLLPFVCICLFVRSRKYFVSAFSLPLCQKNYILHPPFAHYLRLQCIRLYVHVHSSHFLNCLKLNDISAVLLAVIRSFCLSCRRSCTCASQALQWTTKEKFNSALMLHSWLSPIFFFCAQRL